MQDAGLDHTHVLWSLCEQEYIVHKYTLMMEQLLQTSAFQEGVVERLGDAAEPLPAGLRPPRANETVRLSLGTQLWSLLQCAHAERSCNVR